MEKSDNNQTKPRLKVFLIRNAYSFDFGGAERFPVLVAKELKKQGIYPVVVSRHSGILKFARQNNIDCYKGWWWSHQNWSGLRIIGFPVYLLWQILLTAWYFQLFIKLRPDIIHTQSRDDFIAATVAGRLLGKRIIWTDHADLKYVLANYRTLHKNPVGKMVYVISKLAHSIVVVSRGEWKLIEKSLGKVLNKKQFTLIYNGVPDDHIKPKNRPASLKNFIIFSCTSRLVTTKGISELITAFKITHSINPDTHLWLIGDGPEAAKFKHLADDYPAIEFLAYSEDALSYVVASDVFVHPSYNEAFSLSLIEAAKLGKPIIACDVGGNSEIVHDKQNGILIPAKDTDALSGAMENLAVDSKARERFGRASREYYEDKFIFENIVKDYYLPLYEK